MIFFGFEMTRPPSPPFWTFFQNLRPKITALKPTKSAMQFFGSEMTPPSDLSQKNIHFWTDGRPLIPDNWLWMFSPLLNEFCSWHSILWLQTIFVRLPRSVHLRHRWPGIFGKHHQDPGWGQETSRQSWYLREAGPVWRQILASQPAPFLLPTSCSTLRPTAGFWWK